MIYCVCYYLIHFSKSIKLHSLEIVFLGHGEVNIDSTERESEEDRWNRFIKFAQHAHAFERLWCVRVCAVCACVIFAQTEGEYILLILIKDFFLSFGG